MTGEFPVIVVDNGSTDGTAALVKDRFPGLRVISLPGNIGAAARNRGVAEARTPYVAFCDDDSRWPYGSLSRATRYFEKYPHLGLVCGRILVGESGKIDPVCRQLRESPLEGGRVLPGPAIMGFVACGTIVRRSAFLESGGFNEHYGVGGEELLLALSLRQKNWALSYVDELVSHHFPDAGPRPDRAVIMARNDLWSIWMKMPLFTLLRLTGRRLARAFVHGGHRRAFLEALKGLPWVVKRRDPVPRAVEKDFLKTFA